MVIKHRDVGQPSCKPGHCMEFGPPLDIIPVLEYLLGCLWRGSLAPKDSLGRSGWELQTNGR